MNLAADLSSEADRLVGLADSDNPFDYDYAEVLPRQLAAVDARFKDHVEKIKLLENRAESGKVSAVAETADIVPLLFAHTAYKSYPETWLMEQKWDRLGRWLDTVSTNRVKAFDTADIGGLDDWLLRLEEQGHYVSCSSGTTGKCAMMNATSGDLEFAGRSLLQGLIWAGLKPNRDRRMISIGQVASTPRNRASGRPMAEAFNASDVQPFVPDVPPITIGGIVEMVVLRKKIADGTAKPTEVSYYESQALERERAIEASVEQAAEAIIESRHMDLHIMGMPAPLYRVAERVRSKGYSGKDFQKNSTFTSGGLKREQLPSNWRDIIFETLNFAPERVVQSYGMQELNTNSFRCTAGRYHVPPWLMLLLLDESGESLIEPPKSGEAEGRAAFFDLSMEGRWGGVISGDKIRATWEPCSCGNRSPSVADDIQRYADLANGDKIACSGTIDAYVRGVT